MALSKARKEELVARYAELLSQSQGLIFTEYRGMTNQDLTRLRRAVREANGTYHVTKLTLLRRAMEQTGYPLPEGMSGAPIGVVFALADMPALAKALRDFAKTSELMTIRGALMGDTLMSRAQVDAIADLPPLEVLRAQLLGLLDAPAANLVGVLQAGVGQVVNVLHAYVQDQGGEAAA